MCQQSSYIIYQLHILSVSDLQKISKYNPNEIKYNPNVIC